MRRPFALVLLGAALLLVGSGCSDGDHGGTDSADGTTDAEQQDELLGLLADEELDVDELPDERRELGPGEVVVDLGVGHPDDIGYDHTIGALDVLGDDEGLDELAVGCFRADLWSCDVLYEESPAGSLYEAYGATCGARLDEPTSRLCVDVLLPPADDWEGLGGDPFLDELARQCHDGDLLDCDLLFAEADRGSQYEAYGATCARRLEGDADSIDEDCTEAFPL